jgi:hypothetical protein
MPHVSSVNLWVGFNPLQGVLAFHHLTNQGQGHREQVTLPLCISAFKLGDIKRVPHYPESFESYPSHFYCTRTNKRTMSREIR